MAKLEKLSYYVARRIPMNYSRFAFTILLWPFLNPMMRAQASSPEPTALSSGTAKPEPSGKRLQVLRAGGQDPATATVELGSPDPAERGKAIETLRRMGASAQPALATLFENLTDFAGYSSSAGMQIVSVEAAGAVREIDPKAAIPPKLMAKLVHTAIAPATHRLVAGGWVLRCEDQPQALRTLTVLGPLAQSALPDVVRATHKPCGGGLALEALLSFGPPSPDQTARLQKDLSDNDADVRRSVIEYLGQAHVTAAVAALGHAMSDASSLVRLATLETLEKLHPEGEARLPLVKPLLEDPSADVRREAIPLLLELAPQSTVTLALLHERLKDADPSIVLQSARAILKFRPRDGASQEALLALAKNVGSDSGLEAAGLLKTTPQNTKVEDALGPYEERERRQAMDKALIASAPEEREANARTLQVHAARVAKGIRREQPDHAGRVFPASVKNVFFWNEVSVTNVPASLRHVWFLDGKPVYDTTLLVVSPTARVWSSRRIRPGKWRVDVRKPGLNEPIASLSFTVIRQ
jgi:HEAT repeat protein